MKDRGAFIVLEGIDGSGKTTQAKLLASELEKSYHAVYTAEPSENRIGLFIRNACLYEEKRLLPDVEALLFAADRVEHVENEIKPALEEGRLVICDRYIHSSLAYQGSANLSLAWIKAINKDALKPDLAVFIDVSPETVLKRLERRKSVMENLDTQRRVREIYLSFVEKGELIRIDGENPQSQVFEALLAIIQKWLKRFQEGLVS